MATRWALALALLPVQAAAQQAGPVPQPTLRALDVPAANSWQHAETELILPPLLGGLRRQQIMDRSQDELDVVATYRGEDGAVATVHLFKSRIASASIWFDRAMYAVQNDPQLPATAAAPILSGFVPAGRASGGLTAALGLTGAGAVAVAVVPAAPGYLVKVRLVAAGENAAQPAERLHRLLGEIRWPRWSGEEPGAAAMIQPCAKPLPTRRARRAHADLASALLAGVVGAGVGQIRGAIYCREPGATALRGVYRPNAATDAYVVALGDAGLAVSAAPALVMRGTGADIRRSDLTSLTFLDREGVEVLPTFNRLPPPDQAVAVALSGRSSIRVQTD